MLLAHLNYPQTYQPFLPQPVWKEVLEWLTTLPADLPLGEHDIRGRDLYYNHFKVETVAREQAVYEAHQQYIDMHVCLTGGEYIEWMPVEFLTAKTSYDPVKDYTLYTSPPQASSMLMTPQSLALFLPNEAHMTKITDRNNTAIHKVVIKIKKDLVH